MSLDGALCKADRKAGQQGRSRQSRFDPSKLPTDAGVADALANAVSHLQSLGAEVDQVCVGYSDHVQVAKVTFSCCGPRTNAQVLMPTRWGLACAGVFAFICGRSASLLCDCCVRGIQQPVSL